MNRVGVHSAWGAIALAGILAAMSVSPAFAEDLSLAEISDRFEQLSERVSPAVVQIFTHRYTPGIGTDTSDLIDRQESAGSGVLLDAKGYIVTNAHVVQGARRIQVLISTRPGGPPEPRSILQSSGNMVGAQRVGIDYETDLAVLKVGGNDLPFLELADSDELRQGELVFAFGSPRGLQNSVSMGVVSAKARQLGEDHPMVYIQTDATINPGNSGGPLVDTQGRVMGINTMIFTESGGSEGIGFAAPSNIVNAVYRQIRENGRVRRGHIGAFAQTITPLLAEALELPVSWGAILGDVYPEGPAERAGLRAGDVVMSLDGKPMENGRQLDVNLYRKPIGQRVSLEILRASERKTYVVDIIERQDRGLHFEELVSPDRNLVPELGVLALDLDRELRSYLPSLRRTGGVLVASSTLRGGPLQGGFRPGDVIHGLNGREVASLEDLRRLLSGLPTGSPLAIHIEREGRMMYLAREVW